MSSTTAQIIHILHTTIHYYSLHIIATHFTVSHKSFSQNKIGACVLIPYSVHSISMLTGADGSHYGTARYKDGNEFVRKRRSRSQHSSSGEFTDVDPDSHRA